jgi:hypothetical protein
VNGLDHPEKLTDVLALLKKHGVRKFQFGSLQVEFEPVQPAEPKPQPPAEEEKCRCGHVHHQHSETGLCLIGCEPDKCAEVK